MMNDTIILVTEETATDATKQKYKREAQTDELLCELLSITRTEWGTAQQAGYDAEYSVRMFFLDYSGQRTAIFHGKRYAIYRTYRDGERVELYLGTRVGEINAE